MIKKFKKVVKILEMRRCLYIGITGILIGVVISGVSQAFLTSPHEANEGIIPPGTQTYLLTVVNSDGSEDEYKVYELDNKSLSLDEKIRILREAAKEGFYISYINKGNNCLGKILGVEEKTTWLVFHNYFIVVEGKDGNIHKINLKKWNGILYKKIEHKEVEPDRRPTINDPFPEELFPELLEALIIAESSGNPYAYNPKSGARGLTQITSIAWKDLVRVYPGKYAHLTYESDIFNPTVARQAGLDYLKIVRGYLENDGLPTTLPYILA
ncbi:MAG: transglycosylase SLT domain-containing protein, partial [Candidatus Omnitrophota bacterium]